MCDLLKGSSFLFILLSLELNAQYWSPQGARISAMGSASVALIDPWCVRNNQAGMAFLNQATLSVFYENRYYLKAFGYQSIAVLYPTRLGSFGLGMNRTGDEHFGTLVPGIAFARKLGDHFAAGIQLDFARTRLADPYGSQLVPTCEVGLMLKMTKELVFGVHLFNPVRSKLSDYNDEWLPIVMNAGFNYCYSGALNVSIESSKTTGCPMEFLSGIEYRITKNNSARIGFSTHPFRYSFGFGIETQHVSIDIASTYHETLGFSPQASIQFKMINPIRKK